MAAVVIDSRLCIFVFSRLTLLFISLSAECALLVGSAVFHMLFEGPTVLPSLMCIFFLLCNHFNNLCLFVSIFFVSHLIGRADQNRAAIYLHLNLLH